MDDRIYPRKVAFRAREESIYEGNMFHKSVAWRSLTSLVEGQLEDARGGAVKNIIIIIICTTDIEDIWSDVFVKL